MRTLYFENRSVVFCTPEELPEGIGGDEVAEVEGISLYRTIFDNFIADHSKKRLFILNRDADTAFSQFCSCFHEINAGGGVVRNGKGQYLMIYRRNLWDLPKGKQEDGEEMGDCALREVKEETGLSPLQLGRLVCITHHTCTFDGMFSVKHTWWYDMLYSGSGNPVPQVEEEITDARWMAREEMCSRAKASFRSIGEVIANL